MRHRKVRNIELISENDPAYRAYISDILLEKQRLRPKQARNSADLLSAPLENSIRHWLQTSGMNLQPRILHHEELSRNNKFEHRFREIDAVFLENDTYWLVEIKVSSVAKSISKAATQLKKSETILRRKGLAIQLLVIQVNLNYQNSDTSIPIFKEDFSTMISCLTKSKDKSYPFYYLPLNPTGLFQWGLAQGIIDNPDLLDQALEEANRLHAIRVQKDELREKGVPKDEWPKALTTSNAPKDENTYSFNDDEQVLNHPFAEKLKALLKKT